METATKHIQINNMDLIYSEAQLTIVAAAGEGADFGLPGISSRPRKQPMRYSFAGIELIEIDAFEKNIFRAKSSKWGSRGKYNVSFRPIRIPLHS